MASTPKMEYQLFLCIFQNKSAMATLGLKEMGKFLWEGKAKSLPCWLSQLSFANFPIFFKPKVAIANIIQKMQKKKSGIMISGLDAMPLFLLDNLLKLTQYINLQNTL